MLLMTLFSGLLCGTESNGPKLDLPRKLAPVVIFNGVDSRQAKESFVRCDSLKEWKSIWEAHCGPGKATTDLDIDFDSHMVIAIFSSRSRLRPGDISEFGSFIRLRYHPWGDQIIFAPDPDGKKVRVIDSGRGEIDLDKPRMLSFAFVVLPKRTKPVIVEENVQHVIGDPAVWKERAKLPSQP